MNSSYSENRQENKINYGWEEQGKSQSINVTTSRELEPISEGSKSEFIAEHYLGFTKINDNKTSSYQVEHPRWKQAKVINYGIQVDFGLNYGKEFSFLKEQEPDSVFFYTGSEISVSNKQVVR